MNVKFIDNTISSKIVSEYKQATRRIFFLDYDGTLVSFAKYPEMATIDESALEIIRKLANNPRNDVVIISGRDKEFLERQFSGVHVDFSGRAWLFY